MPDRLLRRRIILADGTELRTVNHASEFIAERFDLSIEPAALDHALVLLGRANATGRRGDNKAATDQLELVLRYQRLLS